MEQVFAVVATQNGVLSVLLGNGDGTFAPRTDTTISSETLGAKIRDFNADGIPDIAVTGFDVDILFLLAGRGDGTFEPPIGFPTGHRPHTCSSAISIRMAGPIW